jgi:type IV secretion system protein VirB2
MTRTNHKNERATRRLIMAATLALMLAAPAHAAGSGMPWEAPLEQVVDSITGPVARAAGVIAIVLAGITITFSEGGSGVRKLAFVGLGIAIMFAAVSFFLDFFGFAGGAVI